MTVKELKKKLEQYTDNMFVFVAERKTEFQYGLVNSVRSKEIGLYEDENDTWPKSKDTVVIIDEE